ncbi:hypothetical protein OAP18_01725 [Gammaproteobacteria bacterium]|nr:hypothetical protein [Gammaproteobacteria bacterium]
MHKVSFFLLAVLIVSSAYIVKENEYYSKDERIFHILIAGSSFEIPGNYIWDKSARKNGRRNGVNMHALYPKFEPYTDENSFAFDQPGHGDVVTFLLSWRHGHFSYERNKAIFEEHMVFGSEEVFSDELTKISLMGTYEYRDMYFNEVDENRLFVILCSKNKNVPYPSCRANVIYSDDLMVSIVFSRNLISEWEEIRSGVFVLIDEFMVEGV